MSSRRYVAHAIDGVILLAILAALWAAVAAISSVLVIVVLVLWLTVIHVAYFVLTQRRTGRSPGKGIVGIRVVDATGGPPGTGALVRRSVPLILEYTYVIAFVAMMSSPYRQRLGDRWARTYVISD